MLHPHDGEEEDRWRSLRPHRQEDRGFPLWTLCRDPRCSLQRDHRQEQQYLRAARSNRKPGDLLSCLPTGAHAHPSHLRMKDFLAQLPTSGGTGQRKQTGGEKATGEVSCSHRLPPPLFSSTRAACGPGEGKAHSRLLPTMPQQITPKQQVSKDPGEKADNRRGFNSISP